MLSVKEAEKVKTEIAQQIAAGELEVGSIAFESRANDVLYIIKILCSLKNSDKN